MDSTTPTTRPSKAELLQRARAFVAELCPSVCDLRQDYAAKNIATHLDRAWKEWERAQTPARKPRCCSK